MLRRKELFHGSFFWNCRPSLLNSSSNHWCCHINSGIERRISSDSCVNSSIQDYLLQASTNDSSKLHVNDKKSKDTLKLGVQSKLNAPKLYISPELYQQRYQARFINPDDETVKMVKNIKRSGLGIFSAKQLEELVRNLKWRIRYNDIHQLCLEYLPALEEGLNSTDHDLKELLTDFLIIESILKNYQICERLFSIYIQFPVSDPKMIQIGLKAFIKNGNVHLAKEFYTQALNNLDAFSMSVEELYLFLQELMTLQKYSTMNVVFQLWVEKKCRATVIEGNIMNSKVLQLMHKANLMSKDTDQLHKFINSDVVRKTNYTASAEYEFTEYLEKLYTSKSLEEYSIVDNEIIDRLINKKDLKRHIYLNLLNVAVLKNSHNEVKKIVARVTEDEDIKIDKEFHHIIAKYFVNQRNVKDLIFYFHSQLKQAPKTIGNLDAKLVLLLKKAYLIQYPKFFNELRNEFNLIANDPRLISEVFWLPELRREINKIIQGKEKGAKINKVAIVDNREYQLYKTLEELVNKKMNLESKAFLINITRQRDRLSPDLSFLLTQLFLKNNLVSLAQIVKEAQLQVNSTLPIKIKAIWLSDEIMNRLNTVGILSASNNSLQKLIKKNRISEFENTNKQLLDFNSYIHLSDLCCKIRLYDEAMRYSQKSAYFLDSNNSRNWAMYYFNTLKIFARQKEAKKFIETIHDWNNNSNAKYIDNGHIRQIKAYQALIYKQMTKSLEINPNEQDSRADLVEAFNKEIKHLTENYYNYKFEALEDLKSICDLIKIWLKQDLINQQKVSTPPK